LIHRSVKGLCHFLKVSQYAGKKRKERKKKKEEKTGKDFTAVSQTTGGKTSIESRNAKIKEKPGAEKFRS